MWFILIIFIEILRKIEKKKVFEGFFYRGLKILHKINVGTKMYFMISSSKFCVEKRIIDCVLENNDVFSRKDLQVNRENCHYLCLYLETRGETNRLRHVLFL